VLVRGIARSASFFVVKAAFGEPVLLKQERAPPRLRGAFSSTPEGFAFETLLLGLLPSLAFRCTISGLSRPHPWPQPTLKNHGIVARAPRV